MNTDDITTLLNTLIEANLSIERIAQVLEQRLDYRILNLESRFDGMFQLMEKSLTAIREAIPAIAQEETTALLKTLQIDIQGTAKLLNTDANL